MSRPVGSPRSWVQRSHVCRHPAGGHRARLLVHRCGSPKTAGMPTRCCGSDLQSRLPRRGGRDCKSLPQLRAVSEFSRQSTSRSSPPSHRARERPRLEHGLRLRAPVRSRCQRPSLLSRADLDAQGGLNFLSVEKRGASAAPPTPSPPGPRSGNSNQSVTPSHAGGWKLPQRDDLTTARLAEGLDAEGGFWRCMRMPQVACLRIGSETSGADARSLNLLIGHFVVASAPLVSEP